MTKVQGLLSAIACGLGIAACQQPSQPAKAEPTKQAEAKAQPAAPMTLAKVREDVTHPLTSFLNKPIAEVQAQLGEPPGKGMARSSCVRYLPERVWFRCQYATQRYPDPKQHFDGIEIEYEDGFASGIAFDGWKRSSGPVDPATLLAAVGLELPEPPKVDTPAEGVKRWAWFNNLARLKIGEHQYRVEMTSVNDDWMRTKLSIILNEPLTEAQKAAILQTGGKKKEDAAEGSATTPGETTPAPTPAPTPTPPPTPPTPLPPPPT